MWLLKYNNTQQNLPTQRFQLMCGVTFRSQLWPSSGVVMFKDDNPRKILAEDIRRRRFNCYNIIFNALWRHNN